MSKKIAMSRLCPRYVSNFFSYASRLCPGKLLCCRKFPIPFLPSTALGVCQQRRSSHVTQSQLLSELISLWNILCINLPLLSSNNSINTAAVSAFNSFYKFRASWAGIYSLHILSDPAPTQRWTLPTTTLQTGVGATSANRNPIFAERNPWTCELTMPILPCMDTSMWSFLKVRPHRYGT
jgi:hypothetical protein